MKVGELWQVATPCRVHVYADSDRQMAYYEKYDIDGPELFVVLDVLEDGEDPRNPPYSARIMSRFGIGWIPAMHRNWYVRVS